MKLLSFINPRSGKKPGDMLKATRFMILANACLPISLI
jgi:hypothetical protein